jgi:hypothetical protein
MRVAALTRVGLGCLCALVFSLVLGCAPAFAARGVVGAFGGEGAGNGQFAGALGVAVDQGSGDVYVVDSGNDRVQVFSAAGVYVSQFGLAGAGAGQLSDPQGVAVEQALGNVYVSDAGNRRVDEFSAAGSFVRAFGWGVRNGAAELQVCTTVSTCREGVAGADAGQLAASVGSLAVQESSGDVFLADGGNQRVDVFTAAGAFVRGFGWGVVDGEAKAEVCTSACVAGVAGGGAGQFAEGSPTQVVLDAAGFVYALDSGNGRVQKFTAGGVPVATFASAYLSGFPQVSGLTVEPTLGDVLASKIPAAATGLPEEEQVLELDSAGNLLGSDGQGGRLPGASGLAVGSTAEDVYLSSGDRVLVLNATPPAPPVAAVQAATVLGTGEATLHGTVNAGEPASDALETVYRLEYSLDEVNWSTAGEGRLPAGEAAVAVSATATGLAPDTSYRMRVSAEREYGAGSATSGVGSFTTLAAKPTVGEESFSRVGPRGATVSARIDGEGLPSTYRVQYGLSEAYGSETRAADLPGDPGALAVSVPLSGLSPNGSYHFRFVAENGEGIERGADMTLTTLPLGTEGLPDGRVFEMVTPASNQGAEVRVPESFYDGESFNEGGTGHLPFEVAPDGATVTYIADPTSGGNGKGEAGVGNQYLARRSSSAGGWVQMNIQPPGHGATYYQGFSSDLSTGVVVSGGEREPRLLPLFSGAPGGGYNVLYACADSEGACTDSESTAAQKNPFRSLFGLPPDRSAGEFGTHGAYGSGAHGNAGDPVFAGSSGSGDLFFEANDALLGGEGALEKELDADAKHELEHGENNNYLYDSAAEKLSLVDVLPDGMVAPNATFGAPPFEKPFSNPPDFSHVVSEDGSRAFWTDLASGVVYVRVGGVMTVRVSAGAAPARYWTATGDGRYAFYTESGAEGEELHRFELPSGDSGVGGRSEVLAGPGSRVLGVIGASEDGEDVYVVAEGVLAGANGEGAAPVPGAPNLYLLAHGSAPVFVATLSSEDGSSVAPFIAANPNFVAGALFGDWQPGLGFRTAEVTAGGGSVVFMSNRSLPVVGFPGGYPAHGLDEVYVFQAAGDRLFCVSCSSSGEPPSGAQAGAAGYLPISWRDTYQMQWVSQDGDRVFFDSTVPLVPQDTNNQQDVYEWEREGTGSCTAGSGANGGCVYLLSGGTSESDSWLIGASANGDDVFIVTRAQLAPEDGNEGFDLYDARVGGVQAVVAPACSGASCQGLPPVAQGFAVPSSATFSGAGNVPLPSLPTVVKGKVLPRSLTRAQRLARALVLCRREHQKRRRVVCEARARKRYRVVSKAEKSAKGRG